MKSFIRERIEVQAELRLCTFAKIKSYIENENYIYGIIKYETQKNIYAHIGFEYNIYFDTILLMEINEMTISAYYTLCKN